MNPPAFADSCQDLKLFLITRATTAKSNAGHIRRKERVREYVSERIIFDAIQKIL
jgi:hypothetical protein